MNRPLLCLLLPVALSVGSIPSTAFAYCLGYDKSAPNYDPRYYSVGHERKRSRYVVRAKVMSETWIGEDGKEKALDPPFQKGANRPWGFDPCMGVFYTLRIVSTFKGKPPLQLRVFSENSTARFTLGRGQEILAFVSTGAFDKPIGEQFTLDTCGNSRAFSKARTMMPALRRAIRRGS